MTDQICKTCRFWLKNHHLGDLEDDRSECHRHAPMAIVATNPRADSENEVTSEESEYRAFPVWPMTLEDEWCGEYEPESRNASAEVQAPMNITEKADATLITDGVDPKAKENISRIAETIREAVLAEREACAAIAFQLYKHNQSCPRDCCCGDGAHIAMEIRRNRHEHTQASDGQAGPLS